MIILRRDRFSHLALGFESSLSFHVFFIVVFCHVPGYVMRFLCSSCDLVMWFLSFMCHVLIGSLLLGMSYVISPCVFIALMFLFSLV